MNTPKLIEELVERFHRNLESYRSPSYNETQVRRYYTNSAYGTGSYPRNCQKLVEEAVDLVDAVVDFSDYDNDSDGYVDGLMIVHSGRGAELTASPHDIWSHKWTTY